MKIHKAHQFRLYPTKEQEVLIAKTIGCSRFVFNHFLEKWNTLFEETGNGSTYPACSAELTQLKKELHWLKEVDSISLQSALRHLDDAFSCLQKKQNNKPKFKSKTNPFSPIQPNLRTGTSRYGITTSSCRNWGWYVYRTATRSMAESSTRRSAENQAAPIVSRFWSRRKFIRYPRQALK